MLHAAGADFGAHSDNSNAMATVSNHVALSLETPIITSCYGYSLEPCSTFTRKPLTRKAQQIRAVALSLATPFNNIFATATWHTQRIQCLRFVCPKVQCVSGNVHKA